jgi:hypothetical protein
MNIATDRSKSASELAVMWRGSRAGRIEPQGGGIWR